MSPDLAAAVRKRAQEAIEAIEADDDLSEEQKAARKAPQELLLQFQARYHDTSLGGHSRLLGRTSPHIISTMGPITDD